MRTTLRMLTSTHGRSSRDASVMTSPPTCAATPGADPRGGYEMVSPTVAQLSENGSRTRRIPAHVDRESPRRDDAVLTRGPVQSIEETA